MDLNLYKYRFSLLVTTILSIVVRLLIHCRRNNILIFSAYFSNNCSYLMNILLEVVSFLIIVFPMAYVLQCDYSIFLCKNGNKVFLTKSFNNNGNKI